MATFTESTPIIMKIGGVATATGQQSTAIQNTGNYSYANIKVKVKSSGTGPTAGASYDFYLGRGNHISAATYRSDGAGATSAALTVENSQLLGSIIVTNTADKVFYGDFDTFPLGPLGPEWFLFWMNRSGQTTSVTESDHFKEFQYYTL